MDRPLILEDLKSIDQSHRWSINYWVEGLIHINVRTWYGLQYLTMRLSGYMNYPKEQELISLYHGMEYLRQHPHEPIMYSPKHIFKLNNSPLQCFFRYYKSEINQTQKYSHFLHAYFDEDHARDINYRFSVTSNNRLFNGTIVDWCYKKQIETLRISYDADAREMYTCVLDQNGIINFCRSIGYPIGAPSIKLPSKASYMIE